jgi:hypothetical protein
MSDEGGPYEFQDDEPEFYLVKGGDRYVIDVDDVGEDGFIRVGGLEPIQAEPGEKLLVEDVEGGKGIAEFVRHGPDNTFFIKLDLDKWHQVEWDQTPADLERMANVKDDSDLTLEELKKMYERGESVEVVTLSSLAEQGNAYHSDRVYQLRPEMSIGPVTVDTKIGDVVLVRNTISNEQWACQVKEIDLNMMATVERFVNG